MSEEERGPQELKIERKRGAPVGNQNARTHGFYSKVLTDEERRNLEKAVEVDGLDDEIALLRVKLKSLVEHNPDNLELIVKTTNSLTRMLIAKTSIDPKDKGGLKQLIIDALTDIALPVGISIGKSFKK